MNIPAYCSFDFLLHFSQNSSVDLFRPGGESEALGRLQLQDLILNGMQLHTDLSPERIETHLENPYVKHLVKMNRLQSNTSVFTNLRSNEDAYFRQAAKVTGLFLLSSTYTKEKLAELQNKSGCYFIGNGNNISALFQDQVNDLTARNRSTWGFLKDMLAPHHSLVIADPYLFKEKTVKSCVRLLENVVPQGLKAPYHLTLIASSERKNMSLPVTAVKKAVEDIRQAVGRILPASVVEYHIINKEDFHDRLLITNNVMIYSGSGLDSVNERGEATKDSYWVGVRPYKRLSHNGITGAFCVKMIREKLTGFKRWVACSGQPSSTNPLLS